MTKLEAFQKYTNMIYALVAVGAVLFFGL